jgi:hypothetical protein
MINFITLRLSDNLNNRKKADVFDAFNNHDAYEITFDFEFYNDKETKKDFQEQIEELFRDNCINIKEGKIIKLHAFEKYLDKFKKSIKLKSNWIGHLGNLILWSTALVSIFMVETTWGRNIESSAKIFILLVCFGYFIFVVQRYIKLPIHQFNQVFFKFQTFCFWLYP